MYSPKFVLKWVYDHKDFVGLIHGTAIAVGLLGIGSIALFRIKVGWPAGVVWCISWVALWYVAYSYLMMAKETKGGRKYDPDVHSRKHSRNVKVGIVAVLGVILSVGLGVAFRLNHPGLNIIQEPPPSSSPPPIRNVKIGVIAPLTGDVASYGEFVKNGIELSKMDAPKSEQTVFDLRFEDSKCEPGLAVNAFNKLVNFDRVDVVLGPICSNCTMAVGPLAERARVPLLTPVSSADSISKLGRFVFRLAPFDSIQGQKIATWMRDKGIKTACTLYINNEYGDGLRKVFKEKFEAQGGEVICEEAFMQGDTSVRGQWEQIRRASPDAVFAPAYPAEAIILLRQRYELGVTIPLFGTDPYHDKRVLNATGTIAKAVYFTDVASPNLPQWDEFVHEYRDEYSETPNIVAAQAYDAFSIFRRVILDGGTAPNKVVAGLNKLKGFKGATGVVQFDKNGDCTTAVFNRFQIYNGKYESLKE